MHLKLKFYGASKSVTGSRFLLEAKGKRILVDCGLHQERDLKERDWGPFPVPPDTIDAVLLTHAHLDHCGFLPKLVRQGFCNRIFCTDATVDLTKIMLMDSAKIQMIDAENKKKRHEKNGVKGPHPEIPLYTIQDAQACFPLFTGVEYKQEFNIGENIKVKFHNAGHVLGAAMVELVVAEGKEWRRFIFSGDIGRWNRPIIEDPTVFEQADYVITEATYAERLLPDKEDILKELVDAVNTTVKSGGNLVIPSFALERAQDILYYLCKALDYKMIQPIKVFLDSPMAVDITEIFQKYADLFDAEMRELIKQKKTPFDFPGLNYVTEVDDSKSLNYLRDPAIIIAGSGMATGGRIKHHLISNISRPESTIMFAGYQAAGTLGRNITEEPDEVRILGNYYPVRARIMQMHGFSSHADQAQLLRWNYNLKQAPRHIFVVHGEEDAVNYLTATIKREKGWKVTAPDYRQEFILD